MPVTLVFGGSGKVARQITRLLASSASSHTIYSLIRNPDQIASLQSLGASPIVQSLEESSKEDLVETLRKCKPDVVIWAAGAGGREPERAKSVDYKSAVKAMDAVAAAGVKRYIVVSALDVRDRENKPKPDWYDESDATRSNRVWGVIEPFMSAKLAADKELVVGNEQRGLDYTIVRPGGLTDEAGHGTVNTGKVHLGSMVSREDVGEVVVACMHNPKTIGLVFDVVGGTTPITDAVQRVADDRVDTFDGYY